MGIRATDDAALGEGTWRLQRFRFSRGTGIRINRQLSGLSLSQSSLRLRERRFSGDRSLASAESIARRLRNGVRGRSRPITIQRSRSTAIISNQYRSNTKILRPTKSRIQFLGDDEIRIHFCRAANLGNRRALGFRCSISDYRSSAESNFPRQIVYRRSSEADRRTGPLLEPRKHRRSASKIDIKNS